MASRKESKRRGESDAAAGTDSQLSRVLEALPLPVLVLEGENAERAVVNRANPAVAAQLDSGLTPGVSLRELAECLPLYEPERHVPVPWDERPEVRALEWGETTRLVEYQLPCADRPWRVLLVSAAPLHAPGKGKQVVVTLLDISERRRATQRLAAQYRVSRALSEGDGLEEAAPAILQAIGESLGWSYGALWVASDGRLESVGTWHAPGLEFAEFDRLTRQTALAAGMGLPGRVWQRGQPVWIADVTRDTAFPRRLVAALEGVRAGIGIPIVLDDERLGVLEFFAREVLEPDADLLQTVASFGSQIGQFIQRMRAEAAAREARQRAEDAYQREHQIADRFQRSLLPHRAPPVPGYSLAFTYRPALPEADVGGDFCNVFPISHERLGLVVGDVGGKGLAAAMLAAWAQHATMALTAGERTLPGEVLDSIGRALPFLEEPDRLLTLFLAILEPATGRLCYASAGHEPALIWRQATQAVEVLEQIGPALVSLLANETHASRETRLERGDMLFLYTDGLTDARAGRGSERLGLERVIAVMRQHAGADPPALVREMCRAADAHSRGSLPDDIAMAVIRRLENAEEPTPPVFIGHLEGGRGCAGCEPTDGDQRSSGEAFAPAGERLGARTLRSNRVRG